VTDDLEGGYPLPVAGSVLALAPALVAIASAIGRHDHTCTIWRQFGANKSDASSDCLNIRVPMFGIQTEPITAAATTIHRSCRCPSITLLSIAPPLFISHRHPSAAVQSHRLSVCLWVRSNGERGRWSRQRWACWRREIINVKNMIGAAGADRFAREDRRSDYWWR
jgi:hypothetical protein